MKNKLHPNRCAHNWLVYRRMDEKVRAYFPMLGATVLDVGCGEAPYKRSVLEVSETYIGVDWPGSLHKTQVDCFADVNCELPFHDMAFDGLISISVLEHLYSPEVLLAESFRVLKKGGCAFIQVPWQWQVHEAPHDYFRFTPYGLKYLLEKNGFNSVEIQPLGGLFTTIAMKINYGLKRLVRGPRFVRVPINLALIPVWWITQILALIFDRFDGDPLTDCAGYTVFAKK